MRLTAIAALLAILASTPVASSTTNSIPLASAYLSGEAFKSLRENALKAPPAQRKEIHLQMKNRLEESRKRFQTPMSLDPEDMEGFARELHNFALLEAELEKTLAEI